MTKSTSGLLQLMVNSQHQQSRFLEQVLLFGVALRGPPETRLIRPVEPGLKNRQAQSPSAAGQPWERVAATAIQLHRLYGLGEDKPISLVRFKYFRFSLEVQFDFSCWCWLAVER